MFIVSVQKLDIWETAVFKSLAPKESEGLQKGDTYWKKLDMKFWKKIEMFWNAIDFFPQWFTSGEILLNTQLHNGWNHDIGEAQHARFSDHNSREE